MLSTASSGSGRSSGNKLSFGELLLLLIEDRQCLAPRRLLLVVDLAQVQHGPLHGLVGRDPLVLHDAEVTVILAVLLSVCAAQKQGNSRMPESRDVMEEGRSSLCDFPERRVAAARVMPHPSTKMALECEGQARALLLVANHAVLVISVEDLPSNWEQRSRETELETVFGVAPAIWFRVVLNSVASALRHPSAG